MFVTCVQNLNINSVHCNGFFPWSFYLMSAANVVQAESSVDQTTSVFQIDAIPPVFVVCAVCCK